MSGDRSIPTMDSATWCRTPAAPSAARRLRPEVPKNFSTALSSNEGELARSITTSAPAMASFSPSPVMVLTPVFGAAAIASCLFCFSFSTTFDPINPVPPITTIFMTLPLVAGFARLRHKGAVSVQGCICAAQLGATRSGFVRANNLPVLALQHIPELSVENLPVGRRHLQAECVVTVAQQLATDFEPRTAYETRQELSAIISDRPSYAHDTCSSRFPIANAGRRS